MTEASLAKSTNLRQSSFVAAAEIGLVVENAPHQTAAVPGGGMAGEGGVVETKPKKQPQTREHVRAKQRYITSMSSADVA